MKKTCLLLTLLLLMTGCGPSKRLQSSEQIANLFAQSSASTELKESTETDAVTITETETDEVIRRVTETFDTDKPVDPGTGTPPLRERVTEDIDRRQNTRQETTEETTTETSLSIVEDISLEAQEEVTVETTEQRGLTTAQRVLISIGILAVLAVLVWLALRFKNLLKPLKNILKNG